MMSGASRFLLGLSGTLANFLWLWSFAPPL
jgi:hypothetical protein